MFRKTKEAVMFERRFFGEQFRAEMAGESAKRRVGRPAKSPEQLAADEARRAEQMAQARSAAKLGRRL
jgi:hypothetical protein